jgi:DNA (cytosine-5)-methyltransferase 1
VGEFGELRMRLGKSPAEIAEFLGISERTVFRYESGESKPKGRDLNALRGLIAAGGQPLLPFPRRKPAPADFSFVDLFAGIGGLRRGFEAVGGRCVYTCEWDRYAQKTYKANFPDDQHEIAGDIRKVPIESIPAHDVLLAGFPCQPFSIAGVSKKNALGRPHGFSCDVQGTLFFDLAVIIVHHRPAVFVLENVKNLQRHDKGRTFANIMRVLQDDLGYRVEHRVINSERWVPQKRERIFIVGFRDDTDFDFSRFEVPPGKGPTLGSILEAEVDPKYTLTAHLWNYLQDYKKKHGAKGNGFGFSVFGPDDVTRTLSARYFKDGSEILVRQGGGRPRRLTPHECARLMGFETPDGRGMKIVVSDTQAYRQFGNAVVVPVVEAVARHLRPYILKAVERPARGRRRAVA